MRWAILLALLWVGSASAQVTHSPFILSTASGELFNDSTKNIFDSYDPICDPDDTATSGVIFCDGFEDGYFADTGEHLNSTTDYWSNLSSNGGGCSGCSDTDSNGDVPDANNDHFAVVSPGSIDTGRANFAASGSLAALTTGWGRDIEPAHCLRAVGGDPTHCTGGSASSADEVNHIYVRLYMKIVGDTSERCSGGLGTCGSPAFGSNGAKLVELSRNANDTGGVTYPDFSFGSGSTTPKFGFGADDGERCGASANSGKSGFDGFYLNQNQGVNFNWNTAWDNWVFVEYEVKYNPANDSTRVRLWIDDCGAAGTSCTGTPTLRFSLTNLDMAASSSSGDCLIGRALYLNGWALTQSQEYQWDEIVVRDGTVNDNPIGFAPVY